MSVVTAVRAPGPRGEFMVGCLREFRRDPLGLMERAAQTYGDVVRLRIGPVVAHLVNHPDHIEQVLVRRSANYDKHTRSVAKLRASCGQSLLSTEGEVWQRQRRLIQPAFQPDSVSRFVPEMWDCAARMRERWSAIARAGRPLDIVSEMAQVTFTIAARCLFGADVAQDAPIMERNLAIVLDDAWRRLESWIDWSSLSRVLENRACRTAIREIDQIVYRLIESRRRQGVAANDVLSILLRAHDEAGGAGLSDQELRDACVTLLMAGHETTANALAWTCYLLSGAPSVEARLRDELVTALSDGPPSPADLKRWTYADQVFSEATRLYPSIWIMERRVVADDWLGGFRIPAGSTVLISPYVLHRHPRYWSDSATFDPERFAASAVAERPRLAYLPFGVGPHHCIGQHLALIVARVVLAAIYGRFRLRLAPGQTVAMKPGITLRHRHPVEMIVSEDPVRGVG